MSEELSELESLKGTKELLLKFKHDDNVQKLNNFYYTKSFAEILKVERKENIHSGFIAWILDINEQHDLNDFSIRRFLDILLHYSRGQFDKYEELSNVLYIGNYIINNFFIQTEYSIGKNGFIDIFISMEIIYTENKITKIVPINIIIENKVYSTENKDKLNSENNQTVKYFNHFEKTVTEEERYKKKINFYVYLTPLSSRELNNLEKPQCESEEFIQINYQILLDNIFELVEKEDISQRAKFIVQEYVKSLGKLSNIDSNHKREIMAIGKQEQKLLKNFLDEHQDLFNTALEIRKLDLNLTDEQISDIDKAQATLKDTRNSVRYNTLEEYIVFLENRSKGNSMIEFLRLLIKKITNEFGKNEITITYAPSNINIQNPKSNVGRNVFLYIGVRNTKIYLGFHDLEKEKKLNYPEGKEDSRKGYRITLDKDNFNIDKYLPLLKYEFKRLEKNEK